MLTSNFGVGRRWWCDDTNLVLDLVLRPKDRELREELGTWSSESGADLYLIAEISRVRVG